EYFQLSTSLLQIENEFYGTIRPKQITQKGERPLSAISARGVEYVEVRLMDLDPFSAIGITPSTIRFLDIFLLHCLLSESPNDTPDAIAAQSANRHSVAQRGRQPGLCLLQDDGSHRPLTDWGHEILTACEPVAQRLDEAWPEQGGAYMQALADARARFDNLDTTPSARMMAALSQRADQSLRGMVSDMSAVHRQQLLAAPLSLARQDSFGKMAKESFDEQARIEAADTGDFETWRQQYISAIPQLDQ
ncbi:MAG: glutamate--cysteine ligase, partial [Lautropia sp.]|nr:glutamate--cysteine ligase [Lautropia sp.]